MVRDVGRMAESDALKDAYRFRTPMLRNVALTAPYGHNGAYQTLEGIVRHHLSPTSARAEWTRDMAQLPQVSEFEPVDFIVWSDKREMRRQAAANDLSPVHLDDKEIQNIVAFLHSLTDVPVRLGIPTSVPSGLPVDRRRLSDD
jgi:cytochrome c peroxidase